MRNAPWSRALRIIVEHPQKVRGCAVLTLGCMAAYRETCGGWRGPLRKTEQEARNDQADHLDTPLHKHMENVKKVYR